MSDFQVIPLTRGYDLAPFSCGEKGLDDWLWKSAMPMGGAGLNRTHLWVDEDDAVVGYFTLAPATVEVEGEDQATAPGFILAKLAISESLRGAQPKQGPLLLLAAFQVVLQAAALIGGRFLAVDAPNERPYAFYQANGFTPLTGAEHEHRLVMKISTIQKTLR